MSKKSAMRYATKNTCVFVFGIVGLFLISGTALACKIEPQSQHRIFAEADHVVEGIWVKDNGEIKFLLSENWLGEPLPEGLYRVLDVEIDGGCGSTPIPYQPEGAVGRSSILAASSPSRGVLDIGWDAYSKVEDLNSNEMIELEYREMETFYDENPELIFLSKDAFLELNALARDERAEALALHRAPQGSMGSMGVFSDVF